MKWSSTVGDLVFVMKEQTHALGVTVLISAKCASQSPISGVISMVGFRVPGGGRPYHARSVGRPAAIGQGTRWAEDDRGDEKRERLQAALLRARE